MPDTSMDDVMTGAASLLAAAPRMPRLADGYRVPPHVHRVPAGPVRIDGELCPPSAVQRFDGTPLHYVTTHSGDERGVTQIFTDIGDAADHTGVTLDLGDRTIGPSRAPSARKVTLFGYVDLYEHVDFEGARWTFYASWGNVPDFRKVYPTLWWSTDINDRVSSIESNISADPAGIPAYAVLFEHIDYRGDSLWTSNSYSYPPDTGGGQRSNLAGWNDVASSLAYGYEASAYP